ncbi:MAG: glycosyltransferase [Hyphomicrobiaceae bacterium]
MVGQERKIVAANPDGFEPGWFVLRLGPRDTLSTSMSLILENLHTGGKTSFDMPIGVTYSAQHLLLADSAFHRAWMVAKGVETCRVTLEPISLLYRLALAAQRDPIETVRAVYWRLIGKKVRAKNRLRRLLAPLPGFNFAAWMAARRSAWAGETLALTTSMAAKPGPHLIVYIGGGSTEPIAAQSAEALQEQTYSEWTLLENAEVEGLNEALRQHRGRWLVHLVNGERLEPDALLRIAAAICGNPQVAVVYWDDSVHGLAARVPRLKPDWNAELFLSQDYIGSAAVSCDHALSTGGVSVDAGQASWFDLILCTANAVGSHAVKHLPRILSHRECVHLDESAKEERRAAVTRLIRTRSEAAVTSVDRYGHVRIQWPLPEPEPVVSLVVPTRDRVDLLATCVEGLLHRTKYNALEVIIADNDSRERRTHEYFQSLLETEDRVRIVSCPGPFNFAAINNRAVRDARGVLVGFINNDIEVLEPDWLGEMVGHALRPEIGAVGAKLLYPNGLIQHAGVILGPGGLAGHAHRFYPADHPGYMRRLQCTQFFSAVTAACLLVRRVAFEDVGGFDETAFPVAYNDVDFCLKLRDCGLENLWTPYAILRHNESATREKDRSAARWQLYLQECAALRARWQHVIEHDPHYNPNLTRIDESFLPRAG